MGEEFHQGGVCGGTWWNPNIFSGGGGLSSPCSVAQLGGGCDMGGFGWPNEIVKGRCNNNNQVFDENNNNNSLVFVGDFDSTLLDTLGFGLSPTSSTNVWNQQNHFCKIGNNNEQNFDSILHDNLCTTLNYELGENTSSMINPSNYFPNQDGSSPTTMTTSSNTSGDSSTISNEIGLSTSFPMSSSASYLIQALFDDNVDNDQSQFINTNDYCNELMANSCSWSKLNMNSNTVIVRPPFTPPVFDGGQLLEEQFNTTDGLSDTRASLLNSLQSRFRATKLKHEVHNESERKINENEQATSKKPRIETPSSLPTFKVRKEKLGDRITALQQLVSPFGKTDTASVLHEAIEYIKFLHDQVNGLSAPYLKNGEFAVQHQQGSTKINNIEDNKQDLQIRGLCMVPISNIYPFTQETPVDFWTPTFGGTTSR
ncbi:hypothetical protein RND81_10G024000 [Saponaria officinalis]|uniref:BHLH domain-containing protein n=1 Tax=Saponaria officinalis TaxID=3572 RepID=A0AAW1HZG9_SAPOF